jgi:hypothetical protein
MIQNCDSVQKTVDWVSQILIYQNAVIKLLVTPVDFENWLESSQEHLHFIEGAIQDFCYNLFVLNVERMLCYPCVWI